MLDHHRADEVVAFGGDGSRVAADLLRDASTLAAALPSARPGSHVLMVFEHDRYAFAAALLAAWSVGHAALLPPDGRPITIGTLRDRPDVVALMHDTNAGGQLRVPSLLEGPQQPPIEPPDPPAGCAATVFTSGTTGEPVAWPKTGAALLDEVDLVAKSLGWPSGSRIVATVPPAHLYGLVFGVLLPLCHGGSFWREISQDIESAADTVRRHRADALVSVPVHLRRADRVDAAASTSLERIVSSTSAFDAATVRALAKLEHVRIFDVLGSTETGTTSWRDPRTDESFELAQTDTDAVGLVDWLLEQPGVDDAEVAAISTPDGGRVLLAAVASDGPIDTPVRRGLHDRLEATGSPHELVFVGRLPREATGKLPRGALLGLFGRRLDGTACARSLSFGELELADDPDVVTVRVGVPRDYVYFQGHFDGYPILAGVVQLHELILPLVRRARPDLGPLHELGQLKFLGRITPGDEVRVTLRFAEDRSGCSFAIDKEDERCSAGRLTFASAAEAS